MSLTHSLLLTEVRNSIGYITLNRVAAHNALNLVMVRELQQQLDAWLTDEQVQAVVLKAAGDKAFCAGGDIRDMYNNQRAENDLNEAFFSEEYALDQAIHAYPKPFIAIVDGLVLGGGMGLMQGASVRIVTEHAVLGMPEVAIGYFPDVGSSYFLSRMPNATGIYMGVTGNSINAADAIQLGLADWHIPSQHLVRFERKLDQLEMTSSAADSIEHFIQEFASKQLPGAELANQQELTAQHFNHKSLADIYQSLESETECSWCQDTLETLNSRSPLAMAVTLELLQRGKKLSLAKCFNLERHIGQHWFDNPDFMEGVRALIIDKDKNPQWNPASYKELKSKHIKGLFSDFK